MTTATLPQLDSERADILETLTKARHFLRFTASGLTDEQAGLRTTASELCVGGLIKHVTLVEREWAQFIVEGPTAQPDFESMTEADIAEWSSQFTMLPDETLADVLAEYEKVAAETDQLLRELPDLNVSHPLPKAPWFEPGARWSARRTLLHIATETAQHAGHADIIRESLDGAKSMG
ncbi:DinB family protein [Nocardia lijiangensis]|uniref:DinB family protein n=1 Tax=Nocardia lijiangensis TaxID=299618 RepID=UPI000831615F|nr:DinB family protein [Nocardia lijiangensis]